MFQKSTPGRGGDLRFLADIFFVFEQPSQEDFQALKANLDLAVSLNFSSV